MNTDILLERLRVANPTPDSDRLNIDDSALLVAIDGRSASMTYQAEHRATKRLPTFHDQEPPRTRKPLLVAAAVFTVVVAIGVAAALVTAGSEDRSPATTPQTTTPTPTTTPLLSSLSWSRVPHDEAVFGGAGEQSMFSVTVGGPGLVAVGGADPDTAAVWTSVDGITWSRVPHDEAIFGGGAEMNSVTVGGPGLVAVGGATVWTSVDGITWSRVPHDEAVFSGASMSSVTVGGPGLVAVGDADSDAAVWTSFDGITWSRVPHDEAVFGGEDSQAMRSVTVGGPGLVAVGTDGSHDGEGHFIEYGDAAVWTSVDGIIWSRVPHDEEVFGAGGNPAMLSVTTGGPGLVAVGYDGYGLGKGSSVPVWTSLDGITWTRVPHVQSGLSRRDYVMFGVTAGGPGLVAVGNYSGGGFANGNYWSAPVSGAAVWTSVDGISWSRVFARVEQSMFSVTVGGPGPVAVGIGRDGAAVWVALPED